MLKELLLLGLAALIASFAGWMTFSHISALNQIAGNSAILVLEQQRSNELLDVLARISVRKTCPKQRED